MEIEKWTKEEVCQWLTTRVKVSPTLAHRFFEEGVSGEFIKFFDKGDILDLTKEHGTAVKIKAHLELLKQGRTFQSPSPEYVERWSREQVYQWITEYAKIDGKHADQLLHGRVSGDCLVCFQKQDFEDLAVPRGPAVKIMALLRGLKDNPEPVLNGAVNTSPSQDGAATSSPPCSGEKPHGGTTSKVAIPKLQKTETPRTQTPWTPTTAPLAPGGPGPLDPLLLGILEDLGKGELNKFRFHLRGLSMSPHEAIPLSRLEDKDTTDLAGVMLQHYGPDAALQAMLQILPMLPRQDLMTDLEQKMGHWVVLQEEQVQELKQQLRPDLTALQDRRRRHQELEETYEAMVLHLKGQRVKTERRIRAEFKQLQRFLSEEEEARVAALREEEEQKRKRILLERKTLEEQIRSLSEGLSAVEADLQKDGVAFLSASTRSRTRARTLLSGSDPQLLPGALLDEAKHLGNLAHRVWEEMGRRTTFSPVILDPNTASRWLSLSDDLTSVRYSDVFQKVPKNPERFSKYVEVLGSEGFSSGEHCWEVEVGDHPDWRIGVAKESVDRKGKRNASPDNGNWCLLHESGKYTQGTSKTLTLKRTPERIRVQLDYDGGEVSFYDPEDMTLIYTHQHTFTDNIFPFFSVVKAGEARTKDVRVCGVSSHTQL